MPTWRFRGTLLREAADCLLNGLWHELKRRYQVKANEVLATRARTRLSQATLLKIIARHPELLLETLARR